MVAEEARPADMKRQTTAEDNRGGALDSSSALSGVIVCFGSVHVPRALQENLPLLLDLPRLHVHCTLAAAATSAFACTSPSAVLVLWQSHHAGCTHLQHPPCSGPARPSAVAKQASALHTHTVPLCTTGVPDAVVQGASKARAAHGRGFTLQRFNTLTNNNMTQTRPKTAVVEVNVPANASSPDSAVSCRLCRLSWCRLTCQTSPPGTALSTHAAWCLQSCIRGRPAQRAWTCAGVRQGT